MGRKMLVGLMREGKFSGEVLHSMDVDDMITRCVCRSSVGRTA
jgi:hypothetical protein